MQVKFLPGTGTVKFVEVVFNESVIVAAFAQLHLACFNMRPPLTYSSTRRVPVRCLEPVRLPPLQFAASL